MNQTTLKSKFKLWAFLPPIILVPIITGGILHILFFEIPIRTKSHIPLYLVILLFVIALIWLILGELRTKIIKVVLDHEKITVTNFLGIGVTKVFYLDELDGFTTCLLPSRAATYEYLYLHLNNKKVVKISEFYHRNYRELKQALIQHGTKNLGNERFSYIKEYREIFF